MTSNNSSADRTSFIDEQGNDADLIRRAVPDADTEGHVRTYPGIVDDPAPLRLPRVDDTETNLRRTIDSDDDTDGHLRRTLVADDTETSLRRAIVDDDDTEGHLRRTVE
ncbi:MAG: hypothetical protein QM779_04685 [Propionicimonas sp.]|uniref:hypothetical protein n=1 Tax=Propionicimonas sp. TaxID=1955623 RepID=UPI003D0A2D40